MCHVTSKQPDERCQDFLSVFQSKTPQFWPKRLIGEYLSDLYTALFAWLHYFSVEDVHCVTVECAVKTLSDFIKYFLKNIIATSHCFLKFLLYKRSLQNASRASEEAMNILAVLY